MRALLFSHEGTKARRHEGERILCHPAATALVPNLLIGNASVLETLFPQPAIANTLSVTPSTIPLHALRNGVSGTSAFPIRRLGTRKDSVAPTARQHTSLGQRPRYGGMNGIRAESPAHEEQDFSTMLRAFSPERFCIPSPGASPQAGMLTGLWPSCKIPRNSSLRAFVPSCLRVNFWVSRKDAKTQRNSKRPLPLFFAPWRLCVRFFCLASEPTGVWEREEALTGGIH